jgi:beta-glucosidase/6-phospho-beta-glucosidase/beta-galactosidase
MGRREAGVASGLELWGGLECSHVLIRGRVRDQLLETGHRSRPDDLDRIADLGIRTLRYPLLWAHALRDGDLDFSWHAARFARLAHLGVRPIAGFLHHGSGPEGLDPANPDFPQALAAYAAAAAIRFPDIDLYTPINEPVTTARFAYLYGHWHPHCQDEARFLRAVVGNAVATAAAMRAIRRVNPAAALVQTEDVGRVFATAALSDQAAYENERRFLGFDLLDGRVGRDHAFWRPLLEAGVPERTLDELAAEPCPPAIIGIDHYLTSDRFLDHRPERHPGERVGGNGRRRYVDVAAAWIPEARDDVGILARLREVHARYGLPMAVTEVHNGCTREEQLRWLLDAWRDGLAARAEGIRVVAVGIWSLFGTIDWTSLLTARRGYYESGAFDIRSDPPRPTALARAAAALAQGRRYNHPVLAQPGWWREHAGENEAAPPLRLKGAPDPVAHLESCCARRRIRTTNRPHPAEWGVLSVTVQDDGVQFEFESAASDFLTVEVPASADFINAADAALDLVIDGEKGLIRLEALGPACQYRISRHYRTSQVERSPLVVARGRASAN